MENRLFYHRKIDFRILRQTEKAILLSIISCNSRNLQSFLYLHERDYPGVTNLLELWFPKSWIKKSGDSFYIWEKGLLKNVEKLIQKRINKIIESEVKLAEGLIEEADLIMDEINQKNRTVH